MSLLPVVAKSGPLDAFGVSASAAARAGSGAADASPADAALLNPARIASTQTVELSAGIVVSEDGFKINGKDASLDRYVGFNLGVAARVPLGSLNDRLFVGLVAHFPTEGLYDVSNALPDEPRILFRDANDRHFELASAAAVRLWRTLAVGTGFTLMHDVQGNVSIDFRADNNAHTTDVRVNYNFAPVLGITASPIEGLEVGFVWRGSHRTSLNIPVDVIVSEQIGAIHTSVKGVAFGEPDRFSLGASYDFSSLTDNALSRFKGRIEFGYDHYRDDVASISSVTLFDDAGGVLDTSDERPFKFDDAWYIAASLDWMPFDALTVTAGYAWHTTPVPAQRGILNILDASHHTVSFGLAGWLPETWLSSPRQIGFSTAATFNIFQKREMEKHEILVGHYGYPGITFEGFDCSWHFTLHLNF